MLHVLPQRRYDASRRGIWRQQNHLCRDHKPVYKAKPLLHTSELSATVRLLSLSRGTAGTTKSQTSIQVLLRDKKIGSSAWGKSSGYELEVRIIVQYSTIA